MHVLLTNDDGIFAPGIRALADCFIENGWTVSLCAPDAQRSAVGHGITMREDLLVRRVPWEGACAAYSVSGTPADCVRVGLMTLVREADLVVSGVNDGYNLGSDIVYSGTCAAAREAVMLGRQAIAVSTAPVRFQEEGAFLRAARVAQQSARTLLAHPLARGKMLNINVPGSGEITGFCSATLGRMQYDEKYVPVGEETREGRYYRLNGVERFDAGATAECDDIRLLKNGMATFSVIGGLRDEAEAACNFLQDCGFSPCKTDV